jgi:hypothetical protein
MTNQALNNHPLERLHSFGRRLEFRVRGMKVRPSTNKLPSSQLGDATPKGPYGGQGVHGLFSEIFKSVFQVRERSS